MISFDDDASVLGAKVKGLEAENAALREELERAKTATWQAGNVIQLMQLRRRLDFQTLETMEQERLGGIEDTIAACEQDGALGVSFSLETSKFLARRAWGISLEVAVLARQISDGMIKVGPILGRR